ncbi:hypothetical protein D9757_001306 [Collybiopsis confluens]|uniref:C2H2-type domain-containing protein n=1 Tax=Collybiopsis confluens TaxID=2823264 RepID=A0A8H5I0Z1_9AGAR|nr:hypothetical protein D9757_001306 [Collybiopsis confluens]
MPKYNSEVEQVRCTHNGCDKAFRRASDLLRHLSTHSNEKPNACIWPGCTMKFSQSSALKTHMNVHTGEQPYTCNFCEARFGDPSSRGRHEEEIHNPDKGSYVCPFDECSSTIKRRSAFTHHLKTKHNARLSRSDVDSCNPSLAGRPRPSRLRRAYRRPRRLPESGRPYAVVKKVKMELPTTTTPSKLPDLISFPTDTVRSMAGTPASLGGLSFAPSPLYSLESEYQQDYQQRAYQLPYTSASPAPDPHLGSYLSALESGNEPLPTRPHSVVGSPALAFASSDSFLSSASPSPAPDMTRPYYPTVLHAASAPQASYMLSAEQPNSILEGIKTDEDLDLFLASFTNAAGVSFGLDLEEELKPFHLNWFGLDNSIPVLG